MSTVTTPLCRSCCSTASRSAAVRPFTTSSTRRTIPPQSPYYVDIPNTLQTDYSPPRRQKGVLPVPREIFPARQPDKPSQQYLTRAIPPRKESTKNLSKMTEQDIYKARMTDLRRQHLRSGLLELYNRKVVMSGQIGARSTARQNERAILITQGPRQDDHLTSTSIPSSMRFTTGNAPLPPTPPPATTHARKIANVTQQQAAKRSSRLDALHTLYMHARSFITTEKHLAAEIERIFDNPSVEWGTPANDGTSIWNKEPPVTIAALLQDDTTTGVRQETGLAVKRGAAMRYRTDQQRLRKIAEVLSGGKM